MSAEKTVFSPKQIAEQACGNATGFTLATIAYLWDHDLAVDESLRFVANDCPLDAGLAAA